VQKLLPVRRFLLSPLAIDKNSWCLHPKAVVKEIDSLRGILPAFSVPWWATLAYHGLLDVRDAGRVQRDRRGEHDAEGHAVREDHAYVGVDLDPAQMFAGVLGITIERLAIRVHPDQEGTAPILRCCPSARRGEQ